MKQNKLTAVLLVVPFVIGFWTCVTAEEKAEATRVAKETEGVARVVNNLKVDAGA